MVDNELHSDNIIEIGDFSVEIKKRQYKEKQDTCDHMNVLLDDNGHIVTCQKCNMQISAFYALKAMASHFDNHNYNLKQREIRLNKSIADNVSLLAAKRIESAWRNKHTAPCCPHCNRGILTTDNFGDHRISKDIELRRRQVEIESKRNK